jgi:RNA polymerase sigma-70 factor (ECF subfamily)
MESRLGEVEAVYRQRFNAFRRVAAAVSGDREGAADVVQEAFVRAVRELPSFRGDGPLEAWLWRIVVNAARNHRRDERATVVLPDELETRARAESAEIAAAVSRLPERQRLVLFLRYYADLDYGAIATALDISTGTVGATLNTARTTLRQLLATQEALR